MNSTAGILKKLQTLYRALAICISALVWGAIAVAQPFSNGQEVTLRSDNPKGVPIHRSAKSSFIGYLEHGTFGHVKQLSADGNWLQVSVEDAVVWVLSRSAVAGHSDIETSTPQPGTDRSALLDAACEETGDRFKLVDPLLTVCFDRTWRIPAWVAYRLGPEAMSGPGDRKRSRWEQDERIKSMLQAFDSDYVGTGWHRGHMAPAEAFTRTQDAVDFTHQFSNAVPQAGSVNSGAWSRLEKRVRQFVEQGATVWVFTGSLSLELPKDCLQSPFHSSCRCLGVAGVPINPERKMPAETSARIAVPSHTFKTFLVEQDGAFNGYGFVMTNIPRKMGSYLDYQYSIDRVEELLNIDLYQSLASTVETSVEANLISINPNRRRQNRCP